MSHHLSVTDLITTAATLKASGQIQAELLLYENWVRYNSQDPLLYAVLFNYSVALTDANQLGEARSVLERAAALNPEFMPVTINLGRVYERLGLPVLAVVQWSAGLARMTAIQGTAISYKLTAISQCARALESAGQDAAAEDLLQQSLDIDCHQHEVVQHYVALRQRQLEFPILATTERISREVLMRNMSPLSAAAFTDDPLYQLALAAHYNVNELGTPTNVMQSWPKADAKTPRLRVGYLSSDLRQHAVGYLMTDVFELHDRQRFEVFAYYCGPESHDALHQHFQDTSDHWCDLSQLDHESAARRIAEDGIQILVDLNGYTREARLPVVAQRPAPVVVNWLGFPGTMASPYHHYLIADDWIIPPAMEMFYTEKVLRLPCYQPNALTREIAPRTPTRAEVGLPDEAVVYCCFNGAHKITNFTLDRWIAILAQVPNSVLWLLSTDEKTDARLRDYVVGHGLAAERIVFADKLTNPEHLARYSLADLFLDTAPYGAHTTASDALWVGVPVLTLNGRSFASRVCGSLLQAAGLPELVTNSSTDYIRLAVQLGNSPSELQALRKRLLEARANCSLFDTPRLVERLEELYRQMWDEYERGALPQPEIGNLDVVLELASQVDHESLEMQGVPNYATWWMEKIAARQRLRPIAPDRRLAQLQQLGEEKVSSSAVADEEPKLALV